ncbi:MAG: glycosyl hydrolase [Acidimicrobiales bacterium]
MLLRFAHEMNGNWYPWDEGVNGNARQLRRNVVLRSASFAAAGADNVLWVWSPNLAYPGSQHVDELFPGKNAVDVVGLVGYFGHFRTAPEKYPTFDELYGPTLADIRRLSDLPVLITEASATEEGGFKAAWTADFLAGVASRDDISGFVWFDVVKESDWRVNSSPEALAAFVGGLTDPAFGG